MISSQHPHTVMVPPEPVFTPTNALSTAKSAQNGSRSVDLLSQIHGSSHSQRAPTSCVRPPKPRHHSHIVLHPPRVIVTAASPVHSRVHSADATQEPSPCTLLSHATRAIVLLKYFVLAGGGVPQAPHSDYCDCGAPDFDHTVHTLQPTTHKVSPCRAAPNKRCHLR